MPLSQLENILKQEQQLGVKDPRCAVLATVTTEGHPHSRVVAIREIQPESLLFFTQRLSRKVSELINNPHATLTFWFAMQQKQVVLEGVANPLSYEENKVYWEGLPRERQLRFSSYAPTSGKVIADQSVLEKRKAELATRYANQEIPMCEDYCGFRFLPQTMLFYTIGTSTFSEVIRFSKTNEQWNEFYISP